MRFVVLNGHEESTIIGLDPASFKLKGISPGIARITPLSSEAFRGPWVSHLDKSVSGGESLDSDNTVCVVVGEALLVSIEMASSGGTGLEDVIDLIVGAQDSPEFVSSFIFVPFTVEGGAREGSDGVVGVASDDVLVVAMVLGEGFLKDGSPETFIL